MCICCEKMWDAVDQLDLKRNKSDGVTNQIRRWFKQCSLEQISTEQAGTSVLHKLSDKTAWSRMCFLLKRSVYACQLYLIF